MTTENGGVKNCQMAKNGLIMDDPEDVTILSIGSMRGGLRRHFAIGCNVFEQWRFEDGDTLANVFVACALQDS